MLQKTLSSSRFVFGVTATLLFIMCFYSLFLLQTYVIPMIPTSVVDLIVANEPEINVEHLHTITSSSHVGSAHVPDVNGILDISAPVLVVDSMENKVDAGYMMMVDPTKGCDPSQALLRVYMYDLPPYFHFGLLGWKGKNNKLWPDVSKADEIPSYPGGLNLQHSVEYWLTLDLLASNVEDVDRPCSVIRVADSSQADVIFVPFFASLSYNRHSVKAMGKGEPTVDWILQKKLVDFLVSRPEWRRSKGKDHIIVIHHPNSMFYARNNLATARFVLADFGRYTPQIANLEKDVVAPYKHVVRSIGANISASFEQRHILAYFQGAIHRKDAGVVRQELFHLLKDEKDVHFTYGRVRRKGIREASQGMATSKFCLNIAGDTPSSNRLFDSITSHCVPVIISDHIELPFEDVLDYSKFCIFVRASDAVKPGFLLDLLRGIKKDEWTSMWERLKEVAHHFEYQYPSQEDDAVAMIWQAIARKFSAVKTWPRRRIYRYPKLL